MGGGAGVRLAVRERVQGWAGCCAGGRASHQRVFESLALGPGEAVQAGSSRPGTREAGGSCQGQSWTVIQNVAREPHTAEPPPSLSAQFSPPRSLPVTGCLAPSLLPRCLSSASRHPQSVSLPGSLASRPHSPLFACLFHNFFASHRPPLSLTSLSPVTVSLSTCLSALSPTAS